MSAPPEPFSAPFAASTSSLPPGDRPARLVLGVTGSIAAFRAADLASRLTREGIEVDVVLTDEALKFITPLTFAALTRRPAWQSATEDIRDGQPTHISLGDQADLVLIAPATAHLLAQYTHGLAPDLLTSLLLATPAPVVLAPAMNGKMWLHPATRENVAKLRERGVEFIGPDEGMLACGYQGIGRLYPVEQIADRVLALLSKIRGGGTP